MPSAKISPLLVALSRRDFFRGSAVALLCSVVAPWRVEAAPTGANLTTFLVIRHAEKPDVGDGLSPAGEARAEAYIQYFQNLKLGADALKPEMIYATADSRNSRRPRVTVEPLGHALGLTVNTDYKDKDFGALANVLQTQKSSGRNILICWHHGAMPGLLRALGADTSTLLPDGKWPDEEYDWLIVLRYDQAGHLVDARRINEGLTAGARTR